MLTLHHCLSITAVAKIQPPARLQDILLQHHIPHHTASAAELTLLMACGPFTTSEDLLYTPLRDLLEEVSRLRPQLLLLIGPFVDTKVTGQGDRGWMLKGRNWWVSSGQWGKRDANVDILNG